MIRPKIGFKTVNGYVSTFSNHGKFRWDGNPKRSPKKGEYYLSGALPAAYQAMQDLDTEYFILDRIYGGTQ